MTRHGKKDDSMTLRLLVRYLAIPLNGSNGLKVWSGLVGVRSHLCRASPGLPYNVPGVESEGAQPTKLFHRTPPTELSHYPCGRVIRQY